MRYDWHPLRGRRPNLWLSGMFAAAFVLGACPSVEPPVRSEVVFFPQPAPHVGPTVVMAALGSGTLALENGCLWLKNGTDTDLIIWPPLYRLDASGADLVIFDGTGAKFADVGAVITIGGGEVTSEGSDVDISVWIESRIGREIPAACRVGRYWDAAGGPADVP